MSPAFFCPGQIFPVELVEREEAGKKESPPVGGLSW